MALGFVIWSGSIIALFFSGWSKQEKDLEDVLDLGKAVMFLVFGALAAVVAWRVLRHRERLIIGSECFQIVRGDKHVLAQVPYRNLAKISQLSSTGPSDLRASLWLAGTDPPVIYFDLIDHDHPDLYWYGKGARFFEKTRKSCDHDLELFVGNFSTSSRKILEKLQERYYPAFLGDSSGKQEDAWW